jgi:hypothetical protein
MKKLCSISLAFAATMYLASTALASPVQLLVGQVTKMKFTNYEYLIDNNQNGVIDAGDQFHGILTLSTISNVDGTTTTWANGLSGNEITGEFQITVASGGPLSTSAPPALGTSVGLTFTMGSSDFLNLYLDQTPDYSAGSAGSTSAGDIANATDGTPYFSVIGSDYLSGGNVSSTTAGGVSSSVNYNWANLTTNNTGYNIAPELWKDFSGVVGNFGSMVSDIYWETQLSFVATGSNAALAGWQYKSEDPLYLNTVPEPTTMALFGIGLLFGAGAIKRRSSMK